MLKRLDGNCTALGGIQLQQLAHAKAGEVAQQVVQDDHGQDQQAAGHDLGGVCGHNGADDEHDGSGGVRAMICVTQSTQQRSTNIFASNETYKHLTAEVVLLLTPCSANAIVFFSLQKENFPIYLVHRFCFGKGDSDNVSFMGKNMDR